MPIATVLTVFGIAVLPLVETGGWYTPLSLLLLAPSAFFLLGGLVWLVRTIWPEQAEVPEHAISARAEPAE